MTIKKQLNLVSDINIEISMDDIAALLVNEVGEKSGCLPILGLCLENVIRAIPQHAIRKLSSDQRAMVHQSIMSLATRFTEPVEEPTP